MSVLDWIVVAIYFATMVGTGVWASRRVKNQEDYFMGGRGFGKGIQTLAAFGAGTGAHEPVTVGRTVWTSGLSGIWSAMMWLFVTPVYWVTAVWYRRMRHLTLGDFFVERYQSPRMGAAYAIFAIVFYMFYLSTMFSAIAKFALPILGVPAGSEDEALWTSALIGGVAIVVLAYGLFGGLTAAYLTDVVQGVFIIVLSVILIPLGLRRLGGSSTAGWTELRTRLSSDQFELFGGPAAGEFPPHYVFSLTLLVLVGIVVQPHFIATGGGSARDEWDARVGLVTGNFLKRLCTVGWAITGLIALALLAGRTDLATDPDRVWGVAAREILSPVGFGLVGLMLSCLLAAVMSSADTYMLTSSAVIVRNLYVPLVRPNAGERECLRIARISGGLMLVGAAVVAITQSDVFGQFKMAVEIPLIFAAPFWLGMYWRRANRRAVWWTMGSVTLLFFVMPWALPTTLPNLRSHPSLTVATDRVVTIERRAMTIADRERLSAAGMLPKTDAEWAQAILQVEEQPLAGFLSGPSMMAVDRDVVEVRSVRGGRPIYFADGLDWESVSYETIHDTRDVDGRRTLRMRPVGMATGRGSLHLEMLIYAVFGADLRGVDRGTIETLRLPLRLVLPFVLLWGLSYWFPRDDSRNTDAFFAKMNCEVRSDPAEDAAALRAAWADPNGHRNRKWFPDSDWEFVRPSGGETGGFAACVLVCLAIVGGLTLLG